MKLFWLGFLVGGTMCAIPCYKWAYDFTPDKIKKREQKAFDTGVLQGSFYTQELLKSNDFKKDDFLGSVYRKVYDNNPLHDPR